MRVTTNEQIRDSGFSVIEVLIAIAILGLIIAASTQTLAAVRLSAQRVLPALESVRNILAVARTSFLGLTPSEIDRLAYAIDPNLRIKCTASTLHSADSNLCLLSDLHSLSPVIQGKNADPIAITIIRGVE